MITKHPVLFEALAAAPVLAGLSSGALQLLAEESAVRDFKAGDIIVREREMGHSFFILAEGEVEVVINLETVHEIVLARLPLRAIFGEMCVIDPVPRVASVRAISAGRAIEIHAATLLHLHRNIPEQYAVVISMSPVMSCGVFACSMKKSPRVRDRDFSTGVF